MRSVFNLSRNKSLWTLKTTAASRVTPLLVSSKPYSQPGTLGGHYHTKRLAFTLLLVVCGIPAHRVSRPGSEIIATVGSREPRRNCIGLLEGSVHRMPGTVIPASTDAQRFTTMDAGSQNPNRARLPPNKSRNEGRVRLPHIYTCSRRKSRLRAVIVCLQTQKMTYHPHPTQHSDRSSFLYGTNTMIDCGYKRTEGRG